LVDKVNYWKTTYKNMINHYYINENVFLKKKNIVT